MNQEAGDVVVVLTPEMQRVLAGLRELHWVGEATGSGFDARWVAAVVILLLVVLLVVLWRRSPRQRALASLQRLRQESRSSGEAMAYVSGLVSLLRQVAVSRHARVSCPPGLAGDAWLEWLDRQAPAADRDAFVRGPGRLLIVVPFARPAVPLREAVDVDALHALSGRWLRANLR